MFKPGLKTRAKLYTVLNFFSGRNVTACPNSSITAEGFLEFLYTI
jgi:hypothetical protein